jgi:hypothetical protein
VQLPERLELGHASVRRPPGAPRRIDYLMQPPFVGKSSLIRRTWGKYSQSVFDGQQRFLVGQTNGIIKAIKQQIYFREGKHFLSSNDRLSY